MYGTFLDMVGYYPISEMNLGGIYQLNKDTDASFQDGSDKEDDDTSVESDSRWNTTFPRQTRPSDRYYAIMMS